MFFYWISTVEVSLEHFTLALAAAILLEIVRMLMTGKR